MVARSVRINLNFGDICQNAFLLFGTVARSVRMNLNFGDIYQNAFLMVGTVARFVSSITETVARIISGKILSCSRPFWQKPYHFFRKIWEDTDLVQWCSLMQCGDVRENVAKPGHSAPGKNLILSTVLVRTGPIVRARPRGHQPLHQILPKCTFHTCRVFQFLVFNIHSA